MNWRRLATRVLLADDVISAEETEIIKDEVLKAGQPASREALEFFQELRREGAIKCPDFEAFFFAQVKRVVLVDDHPVVRAGVRALLEGQPDLCVVGEASDAASAEEVVRRTRPDVVLMDLSLGAGPGGAQATGRLTGLPAPPRVLVLTTYDTEADILAALDAGASGYLLKDAPPEDLFRAVRGTARGETVLAPAVAATLVRRASSPGPLPGLPNV